MKIHVLPDLIYCGNFGRFHRRKLMKITNKTINRVKKCICLNEHLKFKTYSWDLEWWCQQFLQIALLWPSFIACCQVLHSGKVNLFHNLLKAITTRSTRQFFQIKVLNMYSLESRLTFLYYKKYENDVIKFASRMIKYGIKNISRNVAEMSFSLSTTNDHHTKEAQWNL